MNISYYIKPNSKGRTMVYATITFKSERIRLSTGINISVSSWDKRRQRIKASELSHEKLNQRLDVITSMLTQVYNDMQSESYIVRVEKYKERCLAAIQEKERGDGGLVTPYYYKWATTDTLKKKSTRQNITSYNLFREYAGSFKTFEQIDYLFISNFIEWLTSRGYATNYIGSQLKNLKAVMNKAYKEGLHNNKDYQHFEKMSEKVLSIYLNEKDIEKLINVELDKEDKPYRDMFMIGYYTAMRFSDYSRLSLSDIRDGMINKFKTQKTGAEVTIPAHPRLVEILNRYDGSSPRINHITFNKRIKEICRLAKIDDLVKRSVTKGGVRQTTQYGKWELVSSHTARRSGATNMYKCGIPPHDIMMITGHTTEKMLMKYICITDEENAQRLAKSKFFNE
jgi:integrase